MSLCFIKSLSASRLKASSPLLEPTLVLLADLMTKGWVIRCKFCFLMLSRLAEELDTLLSLTSLKLGELTEGIQASRSNRG